MYTWWAVKAVFESAINVKGLFFSPIFASLDSFQCIIGSTGPILAVSTAMANLADSFDVPYLAFNAWTSLWLLCYIIICTFFDMTRYVKLATRFTDDIFAFLIVTIFILDAIGSPLKKSGLLWYLSPDHKAHEDFLEEDSDYSFWATGFLSVILGLGTTWTIFFFRGFKTTTFFTGPGLRDSIFDFAVFLSVVIWCCVDKLIFDEVPTESLNVPDKFEPTFQCCTSACDAYWPDDCPDVLQSAGTRSWIVNLFDLNGKSWAIGVAAGPAILAFLACYLDNGITW
jgi:hypothetical protein